MSEVDVSADVGWFKIIEQVHQAGTIGSQNWSTVCVAEGLDAVLFAQTREPRQIFPGKNAAPSLDVFDDRLSN